MEPDSPEITALIADATKWINKGQWPFAKAALDELWARHYRPAYTAAHIGHVCMNLADVAGAIKWHREALSLDPQLIEAQERLIFMLDAQPETTEAEALAERHNWWTRFGRSAYTNRQPHRNRIDSEKRIRVGYIGSDWNFHSAAIAFVSVLDKHTPQIEPVIYSTLEKSRWDNRTQMWKERYNHGFIDASEWSPSMLANTIREDQIDILVDLAGYTAGNRLLTFAYKPAPIQIQAWGYVLGTGCPAMDIVFADSVVATPQIRANLHERVFDLPSILSYMPRPDLPATNPLPCLSGPPMFAVFQRAMKTNADTYAVWRQILERVPDATILFKAPDYSPSVRGAIADAFGPHRDRIDFEFASWHKDHMMRYQQADLSLDPWPQTGGVSTLESCYMGVPVVTLIGERMIQRASASFLTTLGIPEFITQTPEQYIDTAVRMVTTDRDQLAATRLQLRSRLEQSVMCAGYIDHVEAAYRTLWREWCWKKRFRKGAVIH